MSARKIIAELPRLTVAELHAVEQRIVNWTSRQTTDTGRGIARRARRRTPHPRGPRVIRQARVEAVLASFRDLAARRFRPRRHLVQSHEHHAAWTHGGPGGPLAVCPITELGFLRVACAARLHDGRRPHVLAESCATKRPSSFPCDRRVLDSPAITSPRKTTRHLPRRPRRRARRGTLPRWMKASRTCRRPHSGTRCPAVRWAGSRAVALASGIPPLTTKLRLLAVATATLRAACRQAMSLLHSSAKDGVAQVLDLLTRVKRGRRRRSAVLTDS